MYMFCPNVEHYPSLHLREILVVLTTNVDTLVLQKLVIKGADGEDVDLSNIKSETKAQKVNMRSSKIQIKCREYLPKTPICALNVIVLKYMHTSNKQGLLMNQKHECSLVKNVATVGENNDYKSDSILGAKKYFTSAAPS